MCRLRQSKSKRRRYRRVIIGYLRFYVGISPYYYVAAAAMLVGVLLTARRLPLVQRIGLSLLVPYMFMMLAATILLRVPSAERDAVLTPFVSFKEALTSDFWYFEVKANILLFIPFGFLLSMVVKRLNGIPLLAGLLFSATIEIVQYVTRRGVCETDDLITNFMGTLIGFILFVPVKMLLDAHFPRMKKLKE